MCTEHSCLLFLLCPALSICSTLEERGLSEKKGVRYRLGDLNQSLVNNSQINSEMLKRKGHPGLQPRSAVPPHPRVLGRTKPGSSWICLINKAPNLPAPCMVYHSAVYFCLLVSLICNQKISSSVYIFFLLMKKLTQKENKPYKVKAGEALNLALAPKNGQMKSL